MNKPISILTAALTLQLVACSFGTPPIQELALSNASIRAAEAAGAVDHAAKPLRSAQQRVAKAQHFINVKEYDDAKRQLQLATADAELAEATAEARNAELANIELKLSIEMMKNEIARKQDH